MGVRRDAGGRFLERGGTLIPSSRSLSCMNIFACSSRGPKPTRDGGRARERVDSPQKQLEAPGARWSPPGLEALRAPAGGGAGARGHTQSELQGPPVSRPADASLGGSGRQRGGVAGLDADSEIVPCARLSRQRCAQARSACPSPRRPRTSAAPEKLCREVPEDRRARSTRGGEGCFVKGPLREAVLRERCGQDPWRPQPQNPWARWRLLGGARGTEASHPLLLRLGCRSG